MENSKSISLPIKVVIIGCVIGLIVAGVGGYKQFDSKKINEEREDAALKESENALKIANQRLSEIEKKYAELNTQLDAKEDECNSYELGSENWYQNSTRCSQEKIDLESEIFALESEIKLIKTRDYTGYYDIVEPMSYNIYYIIGASIAVLAILGAFIIYLVKGKKTY